MKDVHMTPDGRFVLRDRVNGCISDEIWLLAYHQKEILERRFPNYEYDLYEYPVSIIRFEVTISQWSPSPVSHEKVVALSITFTDSFLRIIIPLDCTEVIPYYDPRFTDDLLSDRLRSSAKELGAI